MRDWKAALFPSHHVRLNRFWDSCLLDWLSGYVCIWLARSRALHVAAAVAEVSKTALTSFLTLSLLCKFVRALYGYGVWSSSHFLWPSLSSVFIETNSHCWRNGKTGGCIMLLEMHCSQYHMSRVVRAFFFCFIFWRCYKTLYETLNPLSLSWKWFPICSVSTIQMYAVLGHRHMDARWR